MNGLGVTLSVQQAAVAVVAITAVTVLAAFHVIDGAAAVAVLSVVAGNAIGYVNGKKSGRVEVASEVATAVTAHLEAAKTPDGVVASVAGANGQ